MDTKVTLSFNAEVIEKAKHYADSRGISLSRLTEVLLERLTAGNYNNLEDFPVSDWVNSVAEGPIEYQTTPRSSKDMKVAYHTKKRK